MDSIDSGKWNTLFNFIYYWFLFTIMFAAETTDKVKIWNNMKIAAYKINVSRLFKLETRNKEHQM